MARFSTAVAADSTLNNILSAGSSAHPDARERTDREVDLLGRIGAAWLHYRRGTAICIAAGAAERGYLVPITSDEQHSAIRRRAQTERAYGLRTCRRAVAVWRALLRQLRAIAPVELWRAAAYSLPAIPTGA